MYFRKDWIVLMAVLTVILIVISACRCFAEDVNDYGAVGGSFIEFDNGCVIEIYDSGSAWAGEVLFRDPTGHCVSDREFESYTERGYLIRKYTEKAEEY